MGVSFHAPYPLTGRLVSWLRDAVPVALLILGSGADLHAQVVVSAFGGAMHTAPATITVEQPALHTALVFPRVPFSGESFNSPIYYGYRIAVRMPGTRSFYIEGEVIHGKIFANGADAQHGAGLDRGVAASAVPFTSVFEEFAMSHGLNFVLANAVFRRSVDATGRWIATVRVGAGPMVPHREIQIEGQREEGYQVAGLGAQVSGGIERTLGSHLSALAEYKFTPAHTRVSLYEGTAQLTTRSHHVVFGIGLTF